MEKSFSALCAGLVSLRRKKKAKRIKAVSFEMSVSVLIKTYFHSSGELE